MISSMLSSLSCCRPVLSYCQLLFSATFLDFTRCLIKIHVLASLVLVFSCFVYILRSAVTIAFSRHLFCFWFDHIYSYLRSFSVELYFKISRLRLLTRVPVNLFASDRAVSICECLTCRNLSAFVPSLNIVFLQKGNAVSFSRWQYFLSRCVEQKCLCYLNLQFGFSH